MTYNRDNDWAKQGFDQHSEPVNDGGEWEGAIYGFQGNEYVVLTLKEKDNHETGKAIRESMIDYGKMKVEYGKMMDITLDDTGDDGEDLGDVNKIPGGDDLIHCWDDGEDYGDVDVKFSCVDDIYGPSTKAKPEEESEELPDDSGNFMEPTMQSFIDRFHEALPFGDLDLDGEGWGIVSDYEGNSSEFGPEAGKTLDEAIAEIKGKIDGNA